MREQQEKENLEPQTPHRETPSMHKKKKEKTRERQFQPTLRGWAEQDCREEEATYLGDQMLPPGKEILRYYFQNVNGIKPQSEQPAWNNMMETIREKNSAIFGFVETNVEWSLPLHSECAQIMRKTFKHRELVTSSSKTAISRTYKPGGTCIGAVVKWQSRVNIKGKDPHGMGRWTYIGIEGKDVKILFILAYRVCEQKASMEGPATAYMKQWTIMRHEGIKTRNQENNS